MDIHPRRALGRGLTLQRVTAARFAAMGGCRIVRFDLYEVLAAHNTVRFIGMRRRRGA